MLNLFQSRSKFGKTLIRPRRKVQGDKKELGSEVL
jgi:hypothetical protein